jgi:hypothetical protein
VKPLSLSSPDCFAVAGIDDGTRGTYQINTFEARLYMYIEPAYFFFTDDPSDRGEGESDGFEVDSPVPELELTGEYEDVSLTTLVTDSYDSLYRITGAAYSDGSSFNYDYDSTSNLLSFSR